MNDSNKKKVLNILFWVVFAVLLMFTLYTIYNRLKPAKLQLIPPPSVENSNGDGSRGEETNSGDNTIGEQNGDNEGEDTEEDREKTMAPDFTLEDLDGNKVSLSDYRGKIVFLNFWATWCPFCVDEMPDLERANKKLLEKGDALILTINQQESPDKVKKFLEKEKLTLPVLMDNMGEVGYMYSVSGIPVTYVINKDGSAYGRIAGPTDENTILEIVEEMTK